MFDNNNKKQLKKYIENRKDKISFFGQSIVFDWFFIKLVSFILIVTIFVFSVDEIRTTLNYSPVGDFDPNSVIRDKDILKKLDQIILKYDEKEKNFGGYKNGFSTTTVEKTTDN